jgi:DICT domain-containing protein
VLFWLADLAGKPQMAASSQDLTFLRADIKRQQEIAQEVSEEAERYDHEHFRDYQNCDHSNSYAVIGYYFGSSKAD